MKYEIRRARHDDATGIITAHRRSIREICCKDYSQDQISAWAGRDFQEGRWHQTMDKDLVWVVSDDKDKIFGFGHLKLKENSPAHIAGLYLVPEVIGIGYGREIVLLMMDECKRIGVSEVNLTATKTAKNFYQEVGFSQTGGASTIKMGDQILECFPMTVNL